jgi:uncharacterized protein YndB with AHSA1/START domain
MTSTTIRTDIVSDTCVKLACTLSAPPERVYRAWTEPEAICQWFCPDPGAVCRVPRFEASVGGGFEILMTTPVGEGSAIGSFLTLDPPKLVEFSFRCGHSSPDIPSSHVSIELTPEGNGTRLVLIDQRIANAEEAKSHLLGWQGCLNGLVDYVGAGN